MSENLEILSKNLYSLFGKDGYLTVPIALSKKSSLKKKFCYNYGCSRSLEHVYSPILFPKKIEEVNTISLNDFLKIMNSYRFHSKPILFKMDIEGSEWEVKEELIKFLKEEKNVKYFKGELHFLGAKTNIEEFLGCIKDIFNMDMIEFVKTYTIVNFSGIRK